MGHPYSREWRIPHCSGERAKSPTNTAPPPRVEHRRDGEQSDQQAKDHQRGRVDRAADLERDKSRHYSPPYYGRGHAHAPSPAHVRVRAFLPERASVARNKSRQSLIRFTYFSISADRTSFPRSFSELTDDRSERANSRSVEAPSDF